MQGQKILRATKSARHGKSAHILKLKIHKRNFAPGHINGVHVFWGFYIIKTIELFLPICVKIIMYLKQ